MLKKHGFAVVAAVLRTEHEKVTSWKRKQMKPDGVKAWKTQREAVCTTSSLCFFSPVPFIYIMYLKRFWRIQTKSDSPLGLARCRAFLVSIDICCIKLNWDRVWHQPAATPLWSRLLRSQGGNLAKITISQIRYCLGGNRIYIQPEPSVGGSCFFRWNAIWLWSSRLVCCVLRQPHPRFWRGGGGGGEVHLRLGPRKLLDGSTGLVRKSASHSTQVQGQTSPNERPPMWAPPFKQTPPPDRTEDPQPGLCAQDCGQAGCRTRSQPHHSSRSKRGSRYFCLQEHLSRTKTWCLLSSILFLLF